MMLRDCYILQQKNRNQNDLENFEIRLGSLTHYVDQRFKNMSEDNHKLLVS